MSGNTARSTIVPVASAGAGAPRTTIMRAGDLKQVARHIGKQVSNVWLPELKWHIERTGRPGVAGLALLGASAVFLFSTQLPVADDVARLRADLSAAQERVANAPQAALSKSVEALPGMPARTEMPHVLGIILKQAGDAQLSIDTAKYEISTTKVGGLVRYQLSFPISGPYPKVREFIDSTLIAVPALAIEDLSITRKSTGDTAIEAQVRMAIFTRGAP